MSFHIIRNDITKVKADAIVNTANPDVAIGGGTESAIYNEAGREKLLLARRQIGPIMPGEVAFTDAYDLEARYIIHVSSPRWQGGDKGEIALLKQCFDKALNMAADKECLSIAFPLLATGTYGFPKRVVIELAVQSFRTFLQEHDMEIYLVVFGSDAVKISGELVKDVQSFIDDHYVADALSSEYKNDRPRSRVSFFGATLASKMNAPKMAEARALNISYEDREVVAEKSLDDALKSIYTDSFEKHLQKIINKKGLKNSEVYSAANISKQYFSKLLKGQVKPSKEKVLALAVGLMLNVDETIDFLRIAGYALSPISQTDVIVEYFIRNKDYNVLKIDIVLFDYGLDPLSK